MFYIYILKSLISAKSYVGFTAGSIEDRVKEHNSGGNKWTKGHKPLKLVYYESFICRQDAVNRELFLKSGIGNRVVKAIIQEFDK